MKKIQLHNWQLFYLLIFTLIHLSFLRKNQTQPGDRPNFVYIIADDVGWNDLGCYGNKVVYTPQIDQLASDGMLYKHAFLTASSCSPSRCSIISGRYPHNTGAAELHSPLPENQIPFPLLLKEAGYYTFQAGKSHFGTPALRGFDKAYELQDAGVGGEERWVRSLQERPKDRPFFAWLAAIDAHRDWQSDQKGTTPALESIQVPPYLVDCINTRRDLAAYYHEISRLDYFVGQVIEELENQGVADRTVVILMSDNGMPFPRAKTRVYDSGMQTPLIIKWPGRIKPGTTCNSLVSAIDLAPTILDIASLEVPPYFQGKSFQSLFANPETPFRKYIYAEHNWHDYEAYERMIRSVHYLYLQNHRTHLSNGGPADSKRSASQADLDSVLLLGLLSAAQADNFIIPRPFEELYDVETDPDQVCNIASLASLEDTLSFYRRQLEKWMEETNDNIPLKLTGDAFDRNTGALLPQIPAFNQVVRGEMPGINSAALSSRAKPGFDD